MTDTVVLRLKHSVERKGRKLPRGSRLETDQKTADDLIARAAAKIEGPEDRDAVDRGIECWALKLIYGGNIIRDVLLELEVATRTVHGGTAANKVQERYFNKARARCDEAWAAIGKCEEWCRQTIGWRPDFTKAMNPPDAERYRAFFRKD